MANSNQMMPWPAGSRDTVHSLLKLSTEIVVRHISQYYNDLDIIPIHAKDQILNVLSKRNLLNDGYLRKLLYKSLRKIELVDCDEIHDSSLLLIAEMCPNLKKIDLNCTAKIENRPTVTDIGVTALARNCRQLRSVYFRRCQNVTDASVIALAQNCPSLWELNAVGCKNLTDASLEALSENCKFLHCIGFAKTQITDQGLFTLCNSACAKLLNELHINGCPNITDEGIEAVIMMCSNMQLLILHGCPLITERARELMEELMGPNSRMKQVTWSIPFP